MTTTLQVPAASSAELMRGMLEEHYAVDTDQLTRMTVHAALPQHFGRDLRTLAMRTASVRQRIAETAQALRRMSEGTYGLCEDCDKAIPLGRLRATPQAAQCAACERRKLGDAFAVAAG
ncbi:TraR/DksA family transcriptional regulator [Actinoplanes regularis]|uniref:Transcriptional regulator, TraR/DksA family n=1 Tax=Actinoplanes regularis TaxID=52697 RepID=A0A239JGY6_9ACTN|nr:TraR/DksA C4-type zinc finger protein [Actinoplanes regularis]SNT05077.1 transcriptional regulator, TraR/DksA family [Actinoplanes regularis]